MFLAIKTDFINRAMENMMPYIKYGAIAFIIILIVYFLGKAIMQMGSRFG